MDDDHFTNNERCTLLNQSEKIHYEEMLETYRNAENEAHDMILSYGLILHLTKLSVSSTSIS